jgi:hypothetical protein
MRPRARLVQRGPDRQFLLSILAGLIAAAIASGVTAISVALATSSMP